MTVRILHGDCREVLAALPAESVQTVVTSPPYWGLRNYGLPPLIWGGDPACTHALGPIGKRHRGGPPGDSEANRGRDRSPQAETADILTGCSCEKCGAWLGVLGLEPTPELYVQHMVEVFGAVHRVLREDGTLWLNLGDTYGTGTTASRSTGSRGISRNTQAAQDIDRVGGQAKQLIGIPWRTALALQAAGWWLRMDVIWQKPNPMPESVRDRCTKAHEYLFHFAKSDRYYYDAEAIKEPSQGGHSSGNGFAGRQGGSERVGPLSGGTGTVEEWDGATRNKRSVWTVATSPFEEAHFATFPTKLIEPCILAGCPRGGTVLDPFGGAGTTGLVADRLHRNAILIELNPDYIEMARRRITGDAPLFAEIKE